MVNIFVAFLGTTLALIRADTGVPGDDPRRFQVKKYNKWRTDVDDAVFQALDDDFNSPGLNKRAQRFAPQASAVVSSFRDEPVSSARDEPPRGFDQKKLPECRLSCGNVLNSTVFVLPPSSENRRGEQYDHTCWILKDGYHTAPGCLPHAGLPHPEHFEWSIREAAIDKTCVLKDFSPSEAAASWLRYNPDRSTVHRRVLTVLMIGVSHFRQIYEAIGCRWKEEISGGYMNAPFSAPEDIFPVLDIIRDGGTCTGANSQFNQFHDPKIHGSTNLTPKTNYACHGGHCGCTDEHTCIDFSPRDKKESGIVLRLCYAQYGFTYLRPEEVHTLESKWGFCMHNFSTGSFDGPERSPTHGIMRVEDIDIIINERKRETLERDLAVLSAKNHSCHRSADDSLYRPFNPVVLRLGMDGFREQINRIIGTAVNSAQNAALTQIPFSEGPPEGASSIEAWTNLSTWRDVAVKSSTPQARARASPCRCDKYDRHHRIPGNPDHVAKAMLAYLASGNTKDDCCGNQVYMRACMQMSHMCTC